MSKDWTPEEAATESERLERIDAKAKRHGLEHAFNVTSEEGELVFDGYGGVAGATVYVEIGGGNSYTLTREDVEELHGYLSRWLEATQ